jgi:phenylacetate-CoA ligase
MRPDGGSAALDAALAQAVAHVPFYRRETGFDGGQVRPLEQWPVLTKTVIRENENDLLATNRNRRDWFHNYSGGSTGQPLRVVQDSWFKVWNWATENYFFRELLGVDPHTAPRVMLWGSRHEVYGARRTWYKRLRLALANVDLLNAHTMTPADLEHFLDCINRRKPEVIKGYAGCLYEVARYVRNSNRRVWRPKALYSTAETLLPEKRAVIEEVFGAPVHELYGSREVGVMGGQCRHGRYHVFSFMNHIEIIDMEGRPVKPGTVGRVLVTQVRNAAMPLIRYEIGDMASPADGPCPCGNPLPCLETVVGRYSDYFVSPEGTLVYGGYFQQVMFNRLWIREYQVTQTKFDLIDIHYVCDGAPVDDDMRDIEHKIRCAMGSTCQIVWHRVDALPRTMHGKLLHTRSLVHPNPTELYRRTT